MTIGTAAKPRRLENTVCDVCGKFIPWLDFDTGMAARKLETPDSEFSAEEYETMCWKHNTDNMESNAI